MPPVRHVGLLLAVVLAASACAGDGGAAGTPLPAATATGTPAALATDGPVTAEPATPGGPAASPNASPADPPAGPGASPASPPPGSPAVATPPDASPAAFDPQRVALTFEQFATGLDALTFLTHAGDGSGLLYAVEQRGVIRVLEPDGAVRDATFLDIRDRVRAGGERGLLGLAFHSAFATNGRLFVNYTDAGGDTVVAEFAGSADAADAGSERRLLGIDQPAANHNGGMLAFGADGFLYVSTGDGGGAGDPLRAGQDLTTHLGKILRIDVDAAADGQPYGIPADNPFVASADARPEIWSYGLRNPWRLSFDRATGAMFIGDVGQGAWEEINAEPAGAGGRNYGWNVMEGPDCFAVAGCDASGLTLPVAWYPRAGGECAVTGGYVYRGQQPALSGAYLFADYCSGRVWALDAATALADGRAAHAELAESGINPGSFGEDEAGELYLAGQGGEILRLVADER